MEGFTIPCRMSRLATLALALFSAGLLLCAASPRGSAAGAEISAEAAASASRKLDGILHDPPSSSQPKTTRFTEQEVNSYLRYDMASEYPAGLSKVTLSFVPGSISGSSDVDFDKLKSASSAAGQLGMLSYLLHGVHTITCQGAFSAANGVGRFDLGAVSIDGLAVPRALVDFLVDAYLKPRFPGLNLDQPFHLPDSIEAVQVEQGSLQVKAGAPH
jgi:hypothetical protein